MAKQRSNPEHLRILASGVREWNAWRSANPNEKPDLRGENFIKRDLCGIDLHDADLYRATFWKATLDGADLRNADLSSTNMNGASLVNADLRAANLRFGRLVAVDLTGARLSECYVYGCSVWNLRGHPNEQRNIVITPKSKPEITVDQVEVAQFIYLLLNNESVRHVIDTITSKVVLILGRFTPERKVVLDAIRDELRNRDYLPVLFDFEKPTNRDITETVSTLAHMARFIIADITDAKSIPQELMKVVPSLPSVPVRPILLASEHEWGMFRDLVRYPWVLEPFLYTDQDHLLGSLSSLVICPAEEKAKEQIGR
ncbi:pentapeptide repeat-containing protein [Paludibaculum fermentans]|uniref:pentapeptide repeat-containing protein n=1 Tax=Paludibaculum fermentans TaxID=1473598 RepID=UPI003EB6CAEB